MIRLLASARPIGGFQQRWICARSASISFCDKVAAEPSGLPSDGSVWISWPVMVWRRGSRLSSSAATLVGSNFGCGLGGGGFLTGGASACLGGSGFGSVFFGSFFFICSSASSAGSGSALAGGAGFGSACFGGGGGSAALAISCFFSTTFGAGSSLGGVGSATFSANGFGVVTFSAVLTPLVSWLNSL